MNIIPLHISNALHVLSAIAQDFCQGLGSSALHRCVRYLCIYAAHMSHALNGSSVLQRFEHSNAIKIHNGIMFNFYLGPPHMQFLSLKFKLKIGGVKYVHTYITIFSSAAVAVKRKNTLYLLHLSLCDLLVSVLSRDHCRNRNIKMLQSLVWEHLPS